jgi:hypothetical protein
MTNRDPDEPERTPNEPGTDVDAAFAEIIAGWDREHGRPEWPDLADNDEDAADSSADPAAELSADASVDAAERDEVEDGLDDDDHFVPPDPPPLPRPQPQTVGAILLFGLGLVLLVVPSMLGFSAQAGLVFGLLAISGGIVWLIARLRQGPPTDSGWDDGAQI